MAVWKLAIVTDVSGTFQSFQAHFRTVPKTRSQLLCSASFDIHYSLIILLDAVLCELLLATVNKCRGGVQNRGIGKHLSCKCYTQAFVCVCVVTRVTFVVFTSTIETRLTVFCRFPLRNLACVYVVYSFNQVSWKQLMLTEDKYCNVVKYYPLPYKVAEYP